jgi:hypothetical protein
MFNYQNEHVWADENHNEIISGHHQERFSISVWTGIINDKLVGPYMLHARLTDRRHSYFLQTTQATTAEDMQLITTQNMWFMHNEQPAPTSRTACDCLDEMFPGRWAVRRGPVSWPP